MKSYLSLVFIPLLFLVSSCTKTVESSVVPNQTILTTVTSSKWSTSDGGKTYSTFISTPEIDSYQNKYGAVLVYGSYDGGVTYEQFPEVYNGVAYSFSHSTGQVEVDIQASDGKTVISPPGSVAVKIVLVASSL